MTAIDKTNNLNAHAEGNFTAADKLAQYIEALEPVAAKEIFDLMLKQERGALIFNPAIAAALVKAGLAKSLVDRVYEEKTNDGNTLLRSNTFLDKMGSNNVFLLKKVLEDKFIRYPAEDIRQNFLARTRDNREPNQAQSLPEEKKVQFNKSSANGLITKALEENLKGLQLIYKLRDEMKSPANTAAIIAVLSDDPSIAPNWELHRQFVTSAIRHGQTDGVAKALVANQDHLALLLEEDFLINLFVEERLRLAHSLKTANLAVDSPCWDELIRFDPEIEQIRDGAVTEPTRPGPVMDATLMAEVRDLIGRTSLKK